MKLQSIIFPKSKFTKKQAYQWIQFHGYKIKFGNKKGPDITLNYYRFRQRAPNKNANYYIKTLNNGIKLVLFI